ncbi:hypothetical protein ZIOFF_039101 [Zingiber officinale]|uniref:Uncharacterized protein n=1 Tax=Zingiber officinale TaxID=94328 RepID=A0A8J5GFI5_ZINOF|nr:hypothetical protein ZIOFF_039101 [Zingiber officinale]
MRSSLFRLARHLKFPTSSMIGSPLHRPLLSSLLEHPIRESFPGDHLQWRSVGSRRGSQFATGFNPLESKQLGSIIDLERATNCSPEELVSVWDDAISSIRSLNANQDDYSAPLHMPHMIFTGLEDYKARGTQASPYFAVTYYTEFAESKDIVLIRGDVVFTSKLSDSEAKWLLDTAHAFYLNDGKYKLVERFNKETHEFEFKDVLRALEMPTL